MFVVGKKRQFLVAVLILSVSAGWAWSQVRTRVELVVVPVNVRDSGGQLVTGLTEEDFEVFEDGKSQTISSFSIDPVPLSAAIVIDDGMSGTALKRLVPLFEVMTSGFTPEDEMTSYRYDHFVWKLSDFTADQQVIHKSFRELARIAETRPAQGEPGTPAAGGPAWLRALAGMISVGSNGPPAGVPNGSERPRAVPTSRVLHDAVFDAATALKTRPVNRRRMIFLISDGQVRGTSTRSLEKNIDFLVENDIQVYAVSTDFALLEGRFGVLDVYARATGGDVYGGGSTRDMERAFTRITEQARHQYVIGYVSSQRPKGTRGVFREISVKSKRSGQTVTHRKGYIQYPGVN